MALSRRREALLGRLGRRRTREREGLFLVEGVRGAGEALAAAGADPPGIRFAVCSPRLREREGGPEVVAALGDAGVEVEWVDDATLAASADTETPQGVLLVCTEPRGGLDDLVPAHPDSLPDTGPEGGLLLLDGVQDPGNAGTLIRVAAAFGLPGVVALEGTVDPWNPKTVRAAAGGLFATRVRTAGWGEASELVERRGMELLAARPRGRDVAEVRPSGPWALVVGNEGRGVRPSIAEAAEAVAVPMHSGAESLNVGVAGAILLYALTRLAP